MLSDFYFIITNLTFFVKFDIIILEIIEKE